MQRRLAGARIGRLATTGDDWPHAVPITFAYHAGSLFSAIDHKRKSGRPLRRLLNIAADPRVSVLVDHYEEDWTRLWWIRVDGLARVLVDGFERAAGLDALRSKYEQYEAQPPDGPVIAVAPVRWSGWSA